MKHYDEPPNPRAFDLSDAQRRFLEAPGVTRVWLSRSRPNVSAWLRRFLSPFCLLDGFDARRTVLGEGAVVPDSEVP